MKKTLQVCVLAVLAMVVGASSSVAAPVAQGSVTVVQDTPPPFFFTATVYYQVYGPADPGSPIYAENLYTYAYTVTNVPVPAPAGYFGVPLDGLDVGVESSAGLLAASPDDGDPLTVPPSAITVKPQKVEFDFLPWFDGTIPVGSSSQQLILQSPFGPNLVAFSVAFDGVSEDDVIPGPVVAPSPYPRTIGFWKNRVEGKKGLLKFFPDGQLTQVIDRAVDISGGIFNTQAELVSALTSKGSRSVEVRAKQQLAALLLNLAAGDLFPSQCDARLFWGNTVDTTGDGVPDLTVGQALLIIQAEILSGDPSQQQHALSLADDINNGIGVK